MMQLYQSSDSINFFGETSEEESTGNFSYEYNHISHIISHIRGLSQKYPTLNSHRSMSILWGGWMSLTTLCYFQNCCTRFHEYASALAWWKYQLPLERKTITFARFWRAFAAVARVEPSTVTNLTINTRFINGYNLFENIFIISDQFKYSWAI